MKESVVSLAAWWVCLGGSCGYCVSCSLVSAPVLASLLWQPDSGIPACPGALCFSSQWTANPSYRSQPSVGISSWVGCRWLQGGVFLQGGVTLLGSVAG